MTSHPTIRVAAGVIRRGGRYLLTQRPPGSHMEGYWEFPGGKLERGEDAGQALERELLEELGVSARAGREIHRLRHDYPQRQVELFFVEAELDGQEPRAVEASGIGWFEPAQMPGLPILPADAPVVRLLELREGGGGGV